eukprot:942611-Amphidinium_carterae.1
MRELDYNHSNVVVVDAVVGNGIDKLLPLMSISSKFVNGGLDEEATTPHALPWAGENRALTCLFSRWALAE